TSGAYWSLAAARADIYALSLLDALPISMQCGNSNIFLAGDASADRPLLHEAADEGKIAGHNAAIFPDIRAGLRRAPIAIVFSDRSEEHTSELQSRENLVCRLLLEKKNPE